MAQEVRLHGGPWHGRIIGLEDGRDHFHIQEPVKDAVRRFAEENADAEAGLSPVPVRSGIYSRVFGSPHDFEWDGWRDH